MRTMSWACPGREVTRNSVFPTERSSVLSSVQLYAYLVRVCASEAFPMTTTLLEAERDVRSVKKLREYEHIHAYVRDSDANVYRLTASGRVVKYPDGQAVEYVST